MGVRAIRGAITVDHNDAAEMLEATRLMLQEIMIRNNLRAQDVISAYFSVTKDLDAVYPAVAARELGWVHGALMCVNEMVVPGSLEKCIRVMVHVDSDTAQNQLHHVYLRGAAGLRPDLKQQKTP